MLNPYCGGEIVSFGHFNKERCMLLAWSKDAAMLDEVGLVQLALVLLLQALHVDPTVLIGVSQKLAREDRVGHVCRSSSVEDEHHFSFECPAYAHIRGVFATLSQGGPHTVGSLVNSSNPTLLGRYIRTRFAHRQFVLEHDSLSV